MVWVVGVRIAYRCVCSDSPSGSRGSQNVSGRATLQQLLLPAHACSSLPVVAATTARPADTGEGALARTRSAARSARIIVAEALVRQRSEAQDRLRWLLHDIDPNIQIPAGALGRSPGPAQCTATPRARPVR